jgi:3-isopropylmalate dehydrogenase
MNAHRIAVIPGDGTGPEVVSEALKVLDIAAGGFGFELALTHFDIGGERYLRTGETLPDEIIDELASRTPSCLAPSGIPMSSRESWNRRSCSVSAVNWTNTSTCGR